MAKFRAERLFIRVTDSIDSFDPNHGIDVDAFAFLMVGDAGTHERTPLSDFTFAPFDQPRWFPASKGLQAVRGFIADLEFQLRACEVAHRAQLESDVQTLRAVEDRLETIDVHDLKFHFLARDFEESGRPTLPPRQATLLKTETQNFSPLAEDELKNLLNDHAKERGGLVAIKCYGLWAVSCDTSETLRRHMLRKELTEFWSNYFEVSQERFIQWREYSRNNIEQGWQTPCRCSHHTRRGNQCSRKGDSSSTPNLFVPGHTDCCAQHKRELSSMESIEREAIQREADVAIKWPDSTT